MNDTARTIAAIDIGTNTIKLSVASCAPDGTLQELVDRAETVRIGYRLDETGMIEPTRIDSAIAALRTFEQIGSDLAAETFIGVATEAVRVASNGDELLQRIAAETSWHVRVIDGDEEAHLSFAGLRDRLPRHGNVLVLDIGGGSTEFLQVKNRSFVSGTSVPIGSGRVADAWFRHEPPIREEMDAAWNAVSDVMVGNRSANQLATCGWDVLVLSGGNGQFLQRLGELLFEHEVFTQETVEALYDRLQVERAEDVARMLGIAEARAQVIPSGVIIARSIIESMRPTSLLAVPSGIRLGLVRACCTG